MAADRTRFYGISVPALANRLCREDLTFAAQRSGDLVDLHLKTNYGYFGSIDKTLAGLFILDDRGDDYTLLDLRERSGQVWFLDHDELRLAPIFDSLGAYGAWRALPLDEDGEPPPYPKPPRARGSRRPTTAQLWYRYRWLVWLFAQPRQIDDTEAVETAIAQLERIGIGKLATAYSKERRLLARDPQLAIFWLLHFTCTGQTALRDDVVSAIGATKNELVRAFVARFGAMGWDGELRVLPPFRKRRSLSIHALAPQLAKQPLELYLAALSIDPVERGLDKALSVWEHAKTAAQREQVRAAIGTLRGPGPDYLRAELAVHDGKPVRCDWLLEHDPYRTRFLELALAAGGGAAIQRRLDAATQIDTLLAGVIAAAAKAVAQRKTYAQIDTAVRPKLRPLSRAEPGLRVLAARRIVNRAADYPNAAIEWAFETLRSAKLRDADRMTLLAHATMRATLYGPAKSTAARVKRGDADAIELAVALLVYDERTCNEYHAKYVKEFVIAALGARLADSLATWLPLLAKPGYERMTSELYSKPLDPDDRGSILKQLSPANRRALAIAMIAQPPPRHSSNDRPREIIGALWTPALHRDLVAAAKRDRKQAARYRTMLEYLDSPKFKTAAADLKAR